MHAIVVSLAEGVKRKKILTSIWEAKLERVGCFKYEPVAGAKANELAGAVADEVKEERWHRFMQAQQEISADILQSKIGRETDVLIDAIDEAEGEAIARSPWDAPEIDGNVFIPLSAGMAPGDKLRVRITEAQDYDLVAEVL